MRLKNRTPLLLLFSVSLLSGNCVETPKAKNLTKMRIGVGRQVSAALVYVALEKGFFEEVGLDPTVTIYPSGKRALVEGLLTHREDVITTAEVPFVWKSFKHKELRLIASIANSNNANAIVARRDRGIHKFADLTGRSIGTQKASAIHYFLHSVIIDKEIPKDSIRVSFHKAETLVDQFAEGTIDAFSAREPFVSQAVEKLGPNAIVLTAPDLYIQNEVVIAWKQEAGSPKRTLFLKALSKAESFVRTHQKETLLILSKSVQANKDELAKSMRSCNFTLGLEQSILSLLESEAQWFSEEILTRRPPSPFFLDYIETSTLEKVRPEAVTLIK